MASLKKFLLIGSLVVAGSFVYGQTKKPKQKQLVNADKYHDNIDDRMKGPHGEKIYIGNNGGRYYIKNSKKIYVPLKKKPVTKQ